MSAILEVSCALAAQGRVRASQSVLTELRRQPGPPGAVAPQLLKNADEQTVAATAAVLQASQTPGLVGCDFSQWGVLAAPRFLARTTMGGYIARFASEGAWGISPHIIPHKSLHSVSGTVSLALKAHGPNFGVGGGPGAVTEVLLTAAALLNAHDLPGLWVVMTERNPEIAPDPLGQPLPGADVCALALALTPWRPGCALPRLCLGLRQYAVRNADAGPLDIAALQQALDRASQEQAPAELALDHGGRLEVSWPGERVVYSYKAPPLLAVGEPFPAETHR